ncbi:MAG: HEAT repeat domain-containing protein [Deltaproteobacteria bacterium]|nr:HEAT repeat domain-containing protein [Deltaproteobacteria bacterium]
MSTVRDKLTNMFSKVMAGTVTREEGTMLLNFLAKEDQVGTIKELVHLIDNPPQGVFPKTILHTISLSRNKLFYNIMVGSLEHKNEDVSILAAQELARLKTSDAKNVLVEHLNSEAYHVRKASAIALVQGFGEGVEIVKKHLMEHSEPFYRSTSAQALATAGRRGMDALLTVLNSGDAASVASAAESIMNAVSSLDGADIPKIFEALMSAGDKKDSRTIVELLKVAASLGSRAKGFEGYVQAFLDYPFDQVKQEARDALRQIRS